MLFAPVTALGMFFCCDLHANEVNAVEYLNGLLIQLPQLTATTVVHVPEKSGGCPGVAGAVCVQLAHDDKSVSTAPAKVTNSKIVQVKDLVFDKTKLVTLPEHIKLKSKTIQNCARGTTSTMSVTITDSGTDSWSVSKTDGVSATNSASFTLSVSVEDVGSASGTLSVNQTVSTSITKSEGDSHTTSISETDSVTVAAKNAISVELISYQIGAELPFTANVIIDGDLGANDNGLTLASQLLNENKRTLPIAGKIKLENLSSGGIRTEDLADKLSCVGHAGKMVEGPTTEVEMPTANAGPGIRSKLKRPPTKSSNSSIKSTRFKELARHDLNFMVQNAAASIGYFVQNASASTVDTTSGPSMGPPDGTIYEVLATATIFLQTSACGFNDLGVANQGSYLRETRVYRTYVGGNLVSSYTKDVDTFTSCYEP